MGMAVEYEILFTPQTDEDYQFELVVTTERERFILPVFAIGKHVQFDVPESIDCGTVVVRSVKSRNLILTNIGRREGTFRLTCDGPFEVQPTKGRVQCRESIRCDITFKPKSVGDFKGALFVEYDHGKKDSVVLHGKSFELDVQAMDRFISLAPTYLTQKTQHGFSISNNSATCVKFQILTGDLRSSIHSSSVSSEHSVYIENGIFLLHPTTGVIPPFTEQCFLVEFQPEYQQEYVLHVPIEVEGCEDLLRITLAGFGIGPDPKFSIEVLEVGNIFVDMTYEHDVSLLNQCPIQAKYELHHSGTDSVLQCTPADGHLLPNEQEKIKVT